MAQILFRVAGLWLVSTPIILGGVAVRFAPRRTPRRTSMSRIDPERWPDRLALERHARALRRAEVDRIARGVAAWAGAWIAHLHASPDGGSAPGPMARGQVHGAVRAR
jgi:hypothetical protein